jgi:hypothetical protein
MKKRLLLIFILIIIVLPIIWWSTQSSLPSGVHLEKEAGLIVAKIEENEQTAPFHIPVTWVNAYPWEKPPVLKDMVLLDETGEKIASIQGELTLDDPFFQPRNWYDREVHGELIFELNADKIMDSSGFTIKPFSTNLREMYIPSEIQLTYQGEQLSYSFDNKLKLFTFKQNYDVINQAWQTNSHKYATESKGNNLEITGLFFNVSGQLNSRIEEILFWLPGMPEDYYENYVQYTFDKGAIQEAHTTGELVGETLSLPLEMSSSNVLFFFPFTDEMKDSNGDSTIYLIPYLKTVDESGKVYYHGGSGSVGPIIGDDNREFQSILIK